jgi:uncharacterized protein
MISRKKKVTQKKSSRSKGSVFRSLIRLFSLLLLLFVLFFSVCTVGYVIFFRTVFAKEILPTIKSAIVFEEPDPPVHIEPDLPTYTEQVQKEEIVQEPRAAEVKINLPQVAIIIDDMGYHESIGKKLLALPFELTYSFLPFAPYTRQMERAAYRLGKTVFLHLPLQPKGNEWDPGPGALVLGDSPVVQKNKLEKCLEEVPHAVGMNNHMGSLYTENEKAMTRLMHNIAGRKLFFVDSYTSSGSIAFRIAQEQDIKSARRDVFLDNTLDEKKICAQLEKLVIIAEKYGVGIGIAHPHQVTVEALTTCGGIYKTRVQYVSIKDVLMTDPPRATEKSLAERN